VHEAPYIGRPAYLDTTGPEGIRWGSITPCRLHLDELTLTYRGKTMRLRFGIHLDSDERRGPSAFAIEAPPFRDGVFVLDWHDGEEGGRSEAPRWIRADRWRSAPEAGAPPGG
jgi:hypothetical protein